MTRKAKASKARKAAGLQSFASWSRPKKIAAGVGVYLAIGLIWSIVMLISAGDTPGPAPSVGSQFVSVLLTSVLWLPLMLISG